jgi:tetratricopeptide (TPR) repeat protein
VLCDLLPESPARARALHGLWWVNFGRGDMARALALARRIVALGDAAGDPNLQITGRIAVGSTLTHMGNLIEAEAQLERGYAVFQSDGARLNAAQFVQEPGVELLCYLALVYWWRGEPNKSRAALADALERAATLKHALTTLMASHFEGVLQLLDGQYERALETSGAAIRVIVGQGIVGGGPTAHTWTHGCAMVALGDVDEGLAEMRSGAEFCVSRGMRLGMIGYYFLYSEACCLARRYDEAAVTVEQGFRFADEGDERALVAPMHRIKATILMAKGDMAGAEAEFGKALALARRQGARCFELGTLLSWSRLPQISRADAAKALRAAVVGSGEGDTIMLLAARTALAEWEARSLHDPS